MATGSAHPHALPGAMHAPAGMVLPGQGAVDAPRRSTGLLASADVIGGVSFALFVSFMCERVGQHLIEGRVGWAVMIGWEAVFLVAAILCVPLLPSGIRHDISIRSTLAGLALDWPELLYASWVLGMYSFVLGGLQIHAGPLGLALAVGTVEEMFFRVLLLGWLVTRVSTPMALTISSVVFGAVHLLNYDHVSILDLALVTPQIAGGFVLGAIYLRTRNPLGPILAHAFWDFPYFMAMGLNIRTSDSMLPWLGLIIYGLWLVRDGVPLPGRVTPVARPRGATTYL